MTEEELLAYYRRINSANPFFKSMIQSAKERYDAEAKKEFYRTSYRYLCLKKEDQKRMRNLNNVVLKLDQDRRSKRNRSIFYLLNNLKRSLGLRIEHLPTQCQFKCLDE